MAGGRLYVLKIRNGLKPGMYLDGDGLYLQVAKGGTKSWVFRYRRKHLSANGKPLQREMGIGSFPLFSLAEARKRRDDQRKLLANGIDPIENRKALKAAAVVEKAKAATFKQCAEKYIAARRHGWKSDKHADQWMATLCPK